MALLLAAAMAALAWCMLAPVRWDGFGRIGALALSFPLHLLVVALVLAVMALVARRRKARVATPLLALAAIVAVAMAAAPTIAVWQQAHAWNVPLSLRENLANAGHFNSDGPPQPERSVSYGTAADGTNLELDVWRTSRPDSGPLRPAVVFVHGGGWTHGHRSATPDWDRWLNGLGVEVFDVEYRMPPPARWLDEVGDVKAAVGWVAAHAADYHVDPARISLMGCSAGANLSMLAAYSAGDPRLPPSTAVPPVVVRSVINLYGPVDLELLYRTCESQDYVHAQLEDYIGGSPEDFPDRYRLLSPLTHVGPGSPPTLTLLGTSDRLISVEHAQLLDAALAQAGVPRETRLLPANDHGFDANWGGFGTQIARAEIQRFLEVDAER